MAVEISPDLQRFVQSVMATGGFRSETEVVEEALRLLQTRQRRLDELRREVAPAVERLARGEGLELDDESLGEFFDDVKARGRNRCQGRQGGQ